MPWRGAEVPGEFPTLGYQVAELIEDTCVIPDRDEAGEPFVLTNEMYRFLLFMYRIDPEKNRFYYHRGAQLVRPQKWGKGPFSASWIIAEAHSEGPVIFDGWDSDGNPVGRPWATPHIQIAAFSEDQTSNVWRVLVPMIELGSLAADMPDTGESRINLSGGGIIEPVSSSARSRLGQRVTALVQDETHAWTVQNGGRTLADTQRRNLAGMGGRFMETTNAWDPAEQSVAQQTFESREPGVYLDDIEPGSGSIRNKAERRRMLRVVYSDSARKAPGGRWKPWIDIDRIEAEIEALLPRDPAQAERFFLNRKVAAEDAAFDVDRWRELVDREHRVPDRAMITVGVDGARFEDALGIVGTELATGFQFVIGIWERPPDADDDYEHPVHEIDGAMQETWSRFRVWRAYVDPQWIDHLLSRWQERWGEKKVVPWYTNRPKQVAFALRAYRSAQQGGDLSHDGNETMALHIGNARRQKLAIYDDDHRPMWTVRKDRPGSQRRIDAAMAGTLSWEARSDAVSDGVRKRMRSVYEDRGMERV